LKNKEDILLADSPEVFAQSVLTLLQDDVMRNSMQSKGYQAVQENYRWSTLGKKLSTFLNSL